MTGYIGDTCTFPVVHHQVFEDACDRPATGGVRWYVFEGEVHWELACERHAQKFPLSDALGVYGQWFPPVGSFLMSAVTSS